MTGATWHGTAVGVLYGGTGVAALTANAVLLGGATVGSVGPGAANTVLLGTGGAPSFGAVNLASAAVTGTLPVANGGTGITSGTAGGVLFYSASGTIASSSALAANQLVIGGGAAGPSTLGSLGSATTVLHGGAGAPSFGAVVLTSDVSGTLPVGNGGTGVAALTANAVLLGGATVGSVGPGAANTVLLGTGGAPSFGAVNLASAAVTGTLPVANGGTGITSGTAGGVLFYSASGTIASSSALAANQLVIGGGAAGPSTLGSLGSATTVLHGGAGAPSFGAVVLTSDVSGTLPVGNGGTGVAALTANAVLLGGATVGSVGPGAANTVLLGTGGAPSFGTISNAYLAAGTYGNITGTGTLTAGATGAGFTVALGTSTITGTLGVGNGGTGVASLTSNAVLLGGATVGSVGPGAANTVLLGTGGAPTFGTISNAYLAAGTYGNITGVGTLTAGTWNATTISPTYGGTGVNNGAFTLTLAQSGTLGTAAYTASTAYAPAAGSTSILTLGTIGTGTWQGSVISPTYGGTGVNNGAFTLTLAQSGTLGTAAYTASTAYAPAAGSTSILTLGTIGTGTWQGSVISPTYGGTGVNNGAFTLTLAQSGTLGTAAYTASTAYAPAAGSGSITTVGALTAGSIGGAFGTINIGGTITGGTIADAAGDNMTGGTLTVGTVNATTLTGAGSGITALNASNIASGTLAVAYGGTGQATYTDGQLLIGDTGTTGLDIGTIAGTANEVIVTNGSGSITLSTPQAIGTGSSPQFSSLTLTGGTLDAQLLAGSTIENTLGALTISSASTLTVTSTNFTVTTGGTGGINNTAIGQATPAAGTFTNLVSTGDLTVGGHIISANASPPSVADDKPEADAVSGTSTDTAGEITVAGAGGSIITLTFAGAGYPALSVPKCFITPVNGAAYAVMATGYNVTSTNTTMVITFTGALAGGEVFDYYTIGDVAP